MTVAVMMIVASFGAGGKAGLAVGRQAVMADVRGASDQRVNQILWAVSCPAVRCTAVDNSGGEVTFDPRAPQPSRERHVLEFTVLYGVACLSARRCVVVDGGGRELTFDPRSPSPSPTPHTVDRSGVLAVTCPTARQCTAVGGGDVVTFDPLSQHPSGSPVRYDPSLYLHAVACPTVRLCVAVGDGGELIFDPLSRRPTGTLLSLGQGGFGVACPSVHQCTAVGDTDVVTFDPRSGRVTGHAVDRGGPGGVACPSLHQCTAVDYLGYEATFDPTRRRQHLASHRIDTGNPKDIYMATPILPAVACPSTRQCTAVDNNGSEVTFNPTSSRPNHTPRTIDVAPAG